MPSRNTIPKQIRQLVLTGDLSRADAVAAFERELSAIESSVGNRRTFAIMSRAAGGTPMKMSLATRRKRHILTPEDFLDLKNQKDAEICAIVIDAMEREDAEPVQKIADAIRFWKGRDPFLGADPIRRWIIFLKSRLDPHHMTMTVGQVVEFINKYTSAKVPLSDDGYSTLRRKCKELNFPLKRPKKNNRK